MEVCLQVLSGKCPGQDLVNFRITKQCCMQRVGFKMKLFKGYEGEYKRRHDALWPELKALLKKLGIKDYSIFLDDETNWLFGYFVISDISQMEELPTHPVMQKWWTYMKDIMETNDNHSPVNTPLKEVFYLP